MKILISSHDAGGAEIISAWVGANSQHHFFYVLQGPAIHIFSKKIEKIHIHSFQELTEIVSVVKFVLTGTSWGSDLEKEVIKIALGKKIRVASYLDHWVNYQERFMQKSRLILPNEIWVGDAVGLELAKTIFKNTPVRFVKNQYFEAVKKEFSDLPVVPRSAKYHLLYICEPVTAISHWKDGDENARRYTEFSALKFFFDMIFKLHLDEKINIIRLRLHPSELREKYDFLIKNVRSRCSCEISVSPEASLLADCAWADFVVGISSMALVIAHLVEKKIFTCIPENANVITLPFNNFLKLEDFKLHESRP